MPAIWLRARSRSLLLLAAIAVLWMATRPYEGVVHDSRLYTLQAMSAADPARFADDLFLRFGSQDRFTVFSHLYGPVLRWAGVSLGAMLLTLAGQAVWLVSAHFLARSVLRDPVHALAAVAGLVALPNAYGAQFAFSYGEPFLTPRLFAEALTLLALGCVVRGFPGRAAAALAAAAAFHPVMALPGASAFFFYKAFGHRGWWAAAVCAGAATIGLAALGIEPFARLGVRLDPAWFEIVRHRAAYAFMGGWSAVDYSILAGQGALAVLALKLPGAELRRMMVAVLLAATVGLGLTAIGADLAQNQLLTNLQPWRATWLLGVSGHLLAVPIVLALVGEGDAPHDFTGTAAFGGVAILALGRLLPGAHVLSALLLTFAVLLVARRKGREPLKPAQHAVAVGLAAGLAFALTQLGFGLKSALEAWPQGYWAQLWAFTLCVSGLGLVAVAIARPVPSSGNAPPRIAAAAVAAAFLLFCAFLGWDQRTAWTRFVESPEPPPSDLAGFVSDGATVFWDGGVELTWFRLNKPSYHSCTQGAGVMFFRETAAAYRHRAESFRFETALSDLCGQGPGGDRVQPTRAELQRACVREPGLDEIVLPYVVEDVPRREWTPPVKRQIPVVAEGKLELRQFDRFHAYSCASLR